ncbi:clathrin light chain [Dimargaris cristalligena]|uniref:Clathrin light chain n=1 Tax=Dimargaris cristalligena TaxID=215637 RepID=A0A4P9ZXB9_9FUNG|nr:clathrin light chain [Dimargaris cristalligena]|eukprot:RKP38314.1 clathrin light chain [Dimargaris cristalligena]
MADLFSFDDAPVSNSNSPAVGTHDHDPTADFLARERAVLGNDANFLQSFASPAPGDDTSFGVLDGGSVGSAPAFQSSPFPDLPTSAGSPHSVPSASLSFNQGSESHAFVADFPEIDSEWRQKQAASIDERDQKSQRTHDETLQKAIQDIDNFYEEYNTKKEQAITHNRANEKFEIQQANTGTPWERVYRQIDLATNSTGGTKDKTKSTGPSKNSALRDTSRMRELISDLRKDTSAPGNMA